MQQKWQFQKKKKGSKDKVADNSIGNINLYRERWKIPVSYHFIVRGQENDSISKYGGDQIQGNLKEQKEGKKREIVNEGSNDTFRMDNRKWIQQNEDSCKKIDIGRWKGSLLLRISKQI